MCDTRIRIVHNSATFYFKQIVSSWLMIWTASFQKILQTAAQKFSQANCSKLVINQQCQKLQICNLKAEVSIVILKLFRDQNPGFTSTHSRGTFRLAFKALNYLQTTSELPVEEFQIASTASCRAQPTFIIKNSGQIEPIRTNWTD